MALRPLLVLIAAMLCAAGCVAERPGPVLISPQTDPQLSRTQQVYEHVLAPQIGGELRIAVLDTPGLAAYSKPSGRLYLTRDLINALSDDELAAVLAHEAAHLLLDGHRHARPAALVAPDASVGVESRADAVGCALLRRAGVCPTAMRSMLLKLRAAPEHAHLRDHLDTRLVDLKSTLN